jgi:hypothetical protein
VLASTGLAQLSQLQHLWLRSAPVRVAWASSDVHMQVWVIHNSVVGVLHDRPAGKGTEQRRNTADRTA